jgi:hypothetical protein
LICCEPESKTAEDPLWERALLAMGPALATLPQNDRIIRPNVSMAFSDASVHGLP